MASAVEQRGVDANLTPVEAGRAKDLYERRRKLAERINEESAKAKHQNMLAEARQQAGVTVDSGAGDRVTDMAVVSEPKVYGEGSPNSFFADLYYTSGIVHQPNSPQYRAAESRQFEWSNQVEHEIADGTKYGRFAEKQFREYFRSPHGAKDHAGGGPDWRKAYTEARSRGRVGLSDKGMPGVESRALTTGGGAMVTGASGAAAFVTPIFTEGDYIPFREFGRAFADETTKRPLPDYGMAVYMPQITSGAAVATSYSEAGAVTESDPAQGYIEGSLIITAGQVTTSQAVLDRTGPNFEYDVVIWDQLMRDYAQKWDTYVLTQALLSATSQVWSGNSGSFVLVPPSGSLPGAGGFIGQIGKAKAGIRTTVGTVLNPNRLFLTPPRWEFIESYADSQGRPLVVPMYAGPFNAMAGGSSTGDVGIEGPTGYRLGGLPVYTDNNIPTTTTANLDQAIVADTTQTWSYEGAPVHRVLPQTLGGNLEVIFQQYSYGTVLQRYPAAVVRINGSGMSAITYVD